MVRNERCAAAVGFSRHTDAGQASLPRTVFPLHLVSETVAVSFGAIHDVVSHLLTALGFARGHRGEARCSVIHAHWQVAMAAHAGSERPRFPVRAHVCVHVCKCVCVRAREGAFSTLPVFSLSSHMPHACTHARTPPRTHTVGRYPPSCWAGHLANKDLPSNRTAEQRHLYFGNVQKPRVFASCRALGGSQRWVQLTS